MRILIASILLCAVFPVAVFAGSGKDELSEAQKKQFLEAFDKLGSDSYEERKAAADAIVSMGTAVLVLLEERRDNPDPEVETAVDRAIRKIKGAAARQRIVELIEATGVNDDPDDILENFASPEEEDRLSAFGMLTRRHTKASVPIVRLFLEDVSPIVVNAAVEELVSLVEGSDSQLAVEILSAAVRVQGRSQLPGEYTVKWIGAFLEFAEFTEEELVEKLKNIKNEKLREMIFTQMVLSCREHHVFAFASMLGDSDRFIRRYCAGGVEVVVKEVLMARGGEIFSFDEEQRKGLAETFRDALQSEDPVVVYVAAGAVGRTGIDCCAEELVGLIDHEDYRTARRAVRSIGLAGSKQAVPALVKALKNGRYEILPEACDSLARLGDPAAFEPLYELIKNKKVPFRELILYAMSRVDFKRCAEVLDEFLSDESVAVRSLAVDRLVSALRLYPEMASEKIAALLKTLEEGENEAKLAAARVIGEVGDMSLLPKLEKLAGHEDPLVRAASFAPAAMIAGENSRQLLEDGIKDTDYHVRVRAAQALGYLGDWSKFIKIRLVPLDIRGDSLVDGLTKVGWATGIDVVFDPGAVRMCSLDTAVVADKIEGKKLVEVLDILGKNHGIAWDAGHYSLFITVKNRANILDSFEIPGAVLGCSEADLAVEKKMTDRVDINAISEDMVSFFSGITARTGVEFRFVEKALEGIAESLANVDFSVSAVPLGELLRLVLAPRFLKARITGGAVEIYPAQ